MSSVRLPYIQAANPTRKTDLSLRDKFLGINSTSWSKQYDLSQNPPTKDLTNGISTLAMATPPQYHNYAPHYNSSAGPEKAVGFQQFEEVPWEQGPNTGKSQPHFNPNTNTTTISSFFTHPRTWSRKKKIIAAVLLLAIIVIIIGAAAGVATQKKKKDICTCPGWTDSNGTPYPPTQYICDANGNDLTTGVTNPCG